MTHVQWTAMSVSKVHEQGYLEFYMVNDGELVQLPQCRPDTVSWKKPQDDLSSGVLSMLQWG